MTRSKQGSPAWVWLLTGMLIGLFVAFLVYLNGKRDGSAPRKESALSAPASNEKRATFDFYTILPELEIPVPQFGNDKPAQDKGPSAKPSGPKADASDNEHQAIPSQFLLQAGSFRSMEDADRLRARLALLGIVAEIQTVTINNNQTWHRVRIGPFADLKEVGKIRKRLLDNKIDTMVLRLKG